MVVVARNTIKNAFGKVLFIGGVKYQVLTDNLNRFFLFNELQTKTYIKKGDISKYFVAE